MFHVTMMNRIPRSAPYCITLFQNSIFSSTLIFFTVTRFSRSLFVIPPNPSKDVLSTIPGVRLTSSRATLSKPGVRTIDGNGFSDQSETRLYLFLASVSSVSFQNSSSHTSGIVSHPDSESSA